jgi:hypothetical protein
MSEETKSSAKYLLIQLNNADSKISNKKKEFINDPKTKELQIFVDKENLTKHFDNAVKINNTAKNMYNSNLKPLLDKDDKDDEQNVLNTIGSIRNLLRQEDGEINFPANRVLHLKKVIVDSKSMFEKATSENQNVQKHMKEFLSLTNKAKTKYPEKSTDIDEKIEYLKNISNTINNAQILMSKEIKKEIMDISLFSDSFDVVMKNTSDINKKGKDLTNKINQLFHSYTKILIDMRQTYFVVIGRDSWNESYDNPDEHMYNYNPREVSLNAYTYFDSIGDQEVGTLGGGLFSGSSSHDISTSLNRSYINGLNIDASENMNSSDNSAEFWIDNMYIENFHKYLIIEDGKKTETDWIKVNEDDYENNFNNLGMEIVSKPYGFYDSEKLVTPAPVGMSYVGNSKYGQWHTNPSGGSFWKYYGMYSMMNDLSGTRYSRDDYNTYYSNRTANKGYYGKDNKSYGTFAPNTYRTGSRYQYSTFAKTNGGDFNHIKNNASIRNAGSEARGRGPGGGGK